VIYWSLLWLISTDLDHSRSNLRLGGMAEDDAISSGLMTGNKNMTSDGECGWK